MEEIYQGAKIDERPELEKAKDYTFEETVAGASPVNWVEKSWDEMRQFPIFDQDGSGSCVAQTMKKLLMVYIWLKTKVMLEPSASHIYQRRSNKPEGGMSGDEVFKIAQKGTTLAIFAPDQKMNDAQMDAVPVNEFMEKMGEALKIGNYMTVVSKDIDTIASIIQETGKAVMTWFYFTYAEWNDLPMIQDPNLVLTAKSTCRHSVASVDFTLVGKKNAPNHPELWGKKALLIDDSWGPKATGGAGRRLITEDFFNGRNWFRAHFQNFKYEDSTSKEDQTSKPKYTFNNDLEFVPGAPITYGNKDVVALQDCLKYLGFFPVNSQSTGYFGSVTKSAVGKFQIKYGIANVGDAGLGRCGPKTRAKLNELFA